MENMLPRDYTGWIAFILGTTSLFISFWKNRRSDTIANLQESNSTLRQLQEDQDKKIANMQKKLDEVVKKTEEQDHQIKTLEQDRETFSGLIRAALIEYFKEHPVEAEKLNVTIKGTITTSKPDIK